MLAPGMFEVVEEGGSLSAGGNVTTRYNDDDQPIESLIHDAHGELLTRIVYNYANGLLVNETLVIVRENLEATRQLQKGFSEEEQRAILARRKALLGQLQGLRMERSYTYDADDRVIRRLTQMGNFKQDETITYNEHGCRAGTVMIQSVYSGGEGGIRLPSSSASADEHYTSVIIACVCAGYKRIQS